MPARKTKPRTQRRTRRVRGRGDYEVEPTPDGISKSLSRLETKLDKVVKPDLKSAASTAGRLLGGLVPLPGAADLGGAAADWLMNKFTGHGDYEVMSNSLIKASSGIDGAAPEPVFGRNGRRGVRVVEREYLGDVFSGPTVVNGATTFFNTSYPINPAQAATFPWLSAIAANFEEYEINGLIFEFRSTSSEFNGVGQALGTIIMSTDYDSLDAPFTSKLQMENEAYSNSVKASCSAMHGCECDRSEKPTKVLFTRFGAPPTGSDLRLFDFGNFQLATFGCNTANVNLGELWVSYDVTLWKKQLVGGLQGGQILAGSIMNSIVHDATLSGTNVLGTTPTYSGNMRLTWDPVGHQLLFPPGLSSGTFFIFLNQQLLSTVTANPTSGTPVNCVSIQWQDPSLDAVFRTIFGPQFTNFNYNDSTSNPRAGLIAIYRITGPNAKLPFTGAAGSYGANAATALTVFQVPNNILPVLT